MSEKRRRLENKLTTLLKGARLKETTLPLMGNMRLCLLDESYPHEILSNEEVKKLMEEPFFWPFCWPAGQVLARWLCTHQDAVKNKKILDFGAGSGVVAIAAALLGAKEVWPFDSDPIACEAIEVNASLNLVSLHIECKVEGLPQDYDLILVADVLYDHDNFPLIWDLKRRGKQIVVADSRINALPAPFVKMGEEEEKTIPDLGDPGELRKVSLFIYP